MLSHDEKSAREIRYIVSNMTIETVAPTLYRRGHPNRIETKRHSLAPRPCLSRLACPKGSTFLPTNPLPSLDLAALLCSRVCHDVISPVGAIVNGLEVLETEEDKDMRGFAMDLIKKSAAAASARLQFCRLAFGAAGSLSAAIDTGDAENVARGLIANDRTILTWNGERRLAPKTLVKLLLNLCLIAAAAAPRGGEVAVDAHSIQPYYATLLAEQAGMAIEVEQAPETVILTARRAAPPAADAAA